MNIWAKTLFLFLSISPIYLAAQTSATNPDPTEFSEEFKVIRGVLIHLLSPVHPDYEEELKVADIKRKVDKELGISIPKLKAKKTNRCYLSFQELRRLLFAEKPEEVQKTFRFSEDCEIDGTIKMTTGQIFRVDLILQGYGEFYRINFLMKLIGTRAPKTGYSSIDANIYDGELYRAQNKYEAALDFFADYSLVIDEKGKLAANKGGSIYVKKKKGVVKVDKIYPLTLP